MKEINLDNYLLDREKKIKLGGKELVFTKLPINRQLKATKIYQDALEFLDKQIEKLPEKERTGLTLEQKADKALSKNIKSSIKFIELLADACIYVVTPAGFFNKVKNFFKGNSISKKWIMNNCTDEQLRDFLSETVGVLQKKTIAGSL